jgi:hypothetical protein
MTASKAPRTVTEVNRFMTLYLPLVRTFRF